jgi:23S rRNA maturation mini-RNase III
MPTSVVDVVSRWRPLNPQEIQVAEALLGDAAAVVEANYPGVTVQAETDPTLAANLTTVVAGMVKRAMIRADGVKSDSESVGPYSHAVTYDNALGNLYLTATDQLLITGYRAAGMSIPYGC